MSAASCAPHSEHDLVRHSYDRVRQEHRTETEAAKRDWGHDETGCTVLHIDMDAFYAWAEVAQPWAQRQAGNHRHRAARGGGVRRELRSPEIWHQFGDAGCAPIGCA